MTDLLDEYDALKLARFNDIELLVPGLRPIARNMLARLNSHPDRRHQWGIFETWRSPTRQAFLVKEGRSKTRFSAHNVGCAFDMVPISDEGHWFWEHDPNKPGIEADWGLLDITVVTHGGGYVQRPIKWDRPHVELAMWGQIRKTMA